MEKDNDAWYYDFTAQFGQYDENVNEFIRYINKFAKSKDNTKIPITWTANSDLEQNGMCYAFLLNNLSLLKQIPVINCGISIINHNDSLTIGTLTHEMTHALIQRNKGIIKNYNNNEILSIYMQLVTAYELNDPKILDIAFLNRIQSMKSLILDYLQDDFIGYEYPEGINYIESSLYAFSLFELYKNSSLDVRKSIREEINKTLTGQRQLEDTLDVLCATQEEGCFIIKDYVKKLIK